MKSVAGFEESYYVTSDGEVFSKDRTVTLRTGKVLHYKGRHIKKALDGKGYYFVMLYRGGIGKMFPIHRLVALSFVPNPNGFPCVNHKDGNPRNNNVDNLEWCTQTYNVNYGDAQKKHSKSVSNRVACFTKEGNLVMVFDSQKEAARHIGVKGASLSYALRMGEGHTCKGYYWKYIEIKNHQTLKRNGSET